MISKGQVFKANEDPYHRWVVLNDPPSKGGLVVIVSLTSYKESADNPCVLEPSDYRELNKKTMVAYWAKKAGSAQAFTQSVDDGRFEQLEDMPAPVLQRIIEGAEKSGHFSKAHLDLL